MQFSIDGRDHISQSHHSTTLLCRFSSHCSLKQFYRKNHTHQTKKNTREKKDRSVLIILDWMRLLGSAQTANYSLGRGAKVVCVCKCVCWGAAPWQAERMQLFHIPKYPPTPRVSLSYSLSSYYKRFSLTISLSCTIKSSFFLRSSKTDTKC